MYWLHTTGIYLHLLAITSFRFELITKYILFACEQWHFEMGWTAYQLWCYSMLWAIVSCYDNGSTHNNNNNKKLPTEWLMNALSIHLSVSIRANRIKIYCKHYTQNTTFNYISHIRCDANITMVEHRRKKRMMGKIHASFPPEWGMNGKNGTSTEMIECIAHSGSILQYFIGAYMSSIYWVCPNERSMQMLCTFGFDPAFGWTCSFFSIFVLISHLHGNEFHFTLHLTHRIWWMVTWKKMHSLN